MGSLSPENGLARFERLMEMLPIIDDSEVAVCVFAYNRPLHLKATVNALLENIGSENFPLVIFCDGRRNGDLTDSVDAVRDFAHSVSGFKSVDIVERNENLGLATSIISGVSEVLSRYSGIIVLEDDILVSPSFLSYMSAALEYFENEDSVVSIHGYLPPLGVSFDRPFFLRGADCWGWATWRRGWAIFEKDGSKLLSELRSRGLESEFDLGGSYPYTKMLKDQIRGRNSSWAIRWHASAFLRDKLTLHPHVSLVHNIGHDGSGAHCSVSETYAVKFGDADPYFEDIPVVHSLKAEKAFSVFFRKQKRRFSSAECIRVLKKMFFGLWRRL